MARLDLTPYIQAGFKSRREYLEDLADQYGVEPYIIFEMASVLGPNEDFDGLVTELEDLEMMGGVAEYFGGDE